MNKTNIKHGYSLMVHDARGAILNPGAEFMQPEAQYWGPQGLDFLPMLAPGAGPAK